MDPWTRLAVLVVLLVGTFVGACRVYGRMLSIEAYIKEMRNHGPLVPADRARAAFPFEDPSGKWTPAVAAPGPAVAVAPAAGEQPSPVAARLAALDADVALLEAEVKVLRDEASGRVRAPGVDARLAAVEEKVTASGSPVGVEIGRAIQDGRIRAYRRYMEGQFAHLGRVWRERLSLAADQAAELDRIVAGVAEEAVAAAGPRQLADVPFPVWQEGELGWTRAIGERLGPSLTVEQRRGLEELVKVPARRLEGAPPVGGN
ncbi:MAG: hypothetical protein HYZ53_15975 [Planctomycetes bacterium]|nr:hypothetical protein [Planctomycetota bacterium]